MNKVLVFAAFIYMVISATAQTPITIYSQNSKAITIDAYDIEGFILENMEEQPTDDDEWIDLGLPSGLLWRSCNYGASYAAALGSFISNQFWKVGDIDFIANISDYKMRAPHEDDINELFTNCNLEKMELEGVIGVKVTGTNGNSIFLPATGILYTDGAHLWRNMLGEYWVHEYQPRAWQINTDYLVKHVRLADSYEINHPLEGYYKLTISGYEAPDFCLSVRPVKDIVSDVIYDCQDWPQFDLDGSENVVSFEIVANNTPVISTEADFITWEITEGDEVPLPNAFEQYFDSNPTTLSGSFRKWTITFTLTPNTTFDWRNATICFKGKRIPWGEDGYIHMSQAPSPQE